MTHTAEQIDRAKKAFAFSSDSDLARFLDISYPTIKNWREEKGSTRQSKQNYVFKAVIEALEKLLSNGRKTSPQDLYNFFVTPRKALGGQSFHQIILKKAKDEDAVELIVYLIDSSAKESLSEESLSSKERFERSYGVISDISCRKAAEENPSILTEILEDTKDAIETSVILEALPYSGDTGFINHIITYLDDFSPLVRESAVTALHAYAEDSEELSGKVIFPALKKRLEKESSAAIQKSIGEALNCHKFEF